jgi:hypothetical protein
VNAQEQIAANQGGRHENENIRRRRVRHLHQHRTGTRRNHSMGFNSISSRIPRKN